MTPEKFGYALSWTVSQLYALACRLIIGALLISGLLYVMHAQTPADSIKQPDIFLHSQPDSKEMQKKAQRFFERQEQHDIYERDKQDSRRAVNCI